MPSIFRATERVFIEMDSVPGEVIRINTYPAPEILPLKQPTVSPTFDEWWEHASQQFTGRSDKRIREFKDIAFQAWCASYNAKREGPK